jgi:hypothetical protein
MSDTDCIDHINRVGVVFFQKIADNIRRSSVSNKPVNSPITTQEA